MPHDVSAQPRASEDRFSRFVDHAADGVFLVAKGGRIVDVNAEGCRTLRYTSEELLELKVLDVLQSLDAEAFDELWESTLPGEPVTVESEARRKDGSLFPVEVRVARLRSDGEELMLALVRDVTARKEAEAALRRWAEQQATVAALGRRALAKVETQAMMGEAVRAVRDTLGVDYTAVLELRPGRESLLLRAGTGWQSGRVGSAVVAVAETHAGKTLENGGPVVVADLTAAGYSASTLLHEHGVVSAMSAIVEGRAEPFGVIGAYTTTAREFTEDDVNFIQAVANVLGAAMTSDREVKLQAHLERSQGLEAIGQLAGGIAHDFNNLLSLIRHYTPVALEGAGQLPDVRADLDEVNKAVATATELTRELLLVFGAQDVAEAEVADVNELLRANEAILRRTAGAGITLRIDLADELWPTRVGADQFEQILVRLAVNARAAMPGGGTLALTTENLAFEEGDYMGRGGRPGRCVRLTVADSGTGMSQDVAAHAFDLFSTTKPAGQGSGLGLSTVYGIARQLGGYAQLDSEPGAGTAVKIYLPAVDPMDGSRPAPGASVGAGRGERILVVEAEVRLRRVTCRILSEHGYEAIEADGLETALAAWDERGSEIDLLLTDVVVPLSSGAELVDRLRAARPDLAVLLISGSGVSGGNGSRQIARVVEKPFSTGGLLRSVREALGERERR
jgi:two-component system cell cycle sensor histidine kinase/response regulator CckA